MTGRTAPVARAPKIGITTPNTRLEGAYYLIKLSVWLCGGRPVPLRTPQTIERTDIQGLVLGGGTDVYPGHYRAGPKARYRYDHDRDEMEMAWLAKATAEGLPILGICRGAQMMNVVNNGTLHMDVAQAYSGTDYPRSTIHKMFYRKPIDVEPRSLLHRLLRARRTAVNSMHSQSIATLGTGLRVTAREDNDVVQAVERHGARFYLGVQFHPEFLIYRRGMRAIFRDLVKAAQERHSA